MSKYYLLLLIPFTIFASNNIAKLQMACDIGNEEACIKLQTLKKNKKSSSSPQKTMYQHMVKQNKGSCVSKPSNLFIWKSYGISADEARDWACAGIERRDARNWRDTGVLTAVEAEAWLRLNVRLSEIKNLKKIGVKTAAEAQKWINAGVSISQIPYWISKGVKNPEGLKQNRTKIRKKVATPTKKKQIIKKISLEKKNGLYYNIGENTPFTGKYTIYYMGGEIKKQRSYKNGLKHGVAQTWYKNGQVENNASFKNGEMNGSVSSWYENGQIQYQTDVKNGKPIAVATVWHKNGQKNIEENHNINGLKHGKTTIWYQDGQIESIANFKNDKIDGLIINWYKNGEVESKGNFKDGKADGETRSFYNDGRLKETRIYENGVLIEIKDPSTISSSSDEHKLAIVSENNYENIFNNKDDSSGSSALIITFIVLVLVLMLFLLKKVNASEILKDIYNGFLLQKGFIITYILFALLCFAVENRAVDLLGYLFLFLAVTFLYLGYVNSRILNAKNAHPFSYSIPTDVANKILKIYIKKFSYNKIDLTEFFNLNIYSDSIALSIIDKKGFFSKKIHCVSIRISAPELQKESYIYVSNYIILDTSKKLSLNPLKMAIVQSMKFLLRAEKKEFSEKFQNQLDTFFHQAIKSIKSKKSQIKNKTNRNIGPQVKLALLMKNPYHNLGEAIKLDLILKSPIYKLYKYLIEHGLQKNNTLDKSQFLQQILYMSDLTSIRKLIIQQEENLMKNMLSVVQENRKIFMSLNGLLPPGIFTINDQEILFLQAKIASLKNQFMKELKQLEENKNIFLQHDRNEQEQVLTEVIATLRLQKCYKKIDNICFVSALNIVMELSANTTALNSFKNWARQYDKVYVESLQVYKQNIEKLSNDISSVIIYHYELSHKFFIQDKAKKAYISRIKGLLQEFYFDDKNQQKIVEINHLKNL